MINILNKIWSLITLIDHLFFKNFIIFYEHLAYQGVLCCFQSNLLWTFDLSRGFYEHLTTQSKSDYQGVLCCFHIFLNIFRVNWAQEMVSDHTFCACFWRNPIPNFNFCGEMLVFKCAPKTHIRLAHLGTQFVFLCSNV